jgi:PAS domain S-box-containing protein
MKNSLTSKPELIKEISALRKKIHQLEQAETDRTRTEEALQRSESRLSGIIEFLPDATFAIDLEGKIILWNKAIEEMTGFPAEMMLGKGNYEYAIPLYGERRPILVDLLFLWDGDKAEKYSFIRKEGATLYTETDASCIRGQNRTLWAKASPLRDERGDIIGAIESIRDVTEHKQAEQEREKLILELQGALKKVKTLSGLLPICASCKKIRNDKGYWERIEVYIRDHSEADFSHGICPECIERLYPKYFKKKMGK